MPVDSEETLSQLEETLRDKAKGAQLVCFNFGSLLLHRFCLMTPALAYEPLF
jgi:hypothetical protein